MIFVKIIWQDHHSSYGWFEPNEVAPDKLYNTSVGILVHKDEDHVTIAQTMVREGEQYGDLLNIITPNILEYRELN